jgi:predicted metal-dependent hydrolase
MLAASSLINRLVPDEPFPPYAFVPGRSPHPTSDPAGHSFRVEPAISPKFEPEEWQTCRLYLYGIDLFNGRFYWESHVAWESLWIASGRKGTTANFLKGLIKLAAAGVKALEGKSEGVKSHSGRAAELWREGRSLMTEQDCFMGFRLRALIDIADEIYEKGWPSEPPLLLPTLRK